jgi:hypothetical protein
MFAKEARSGKEHRDLSDTDKLSTMSNKEYQLSIHIQTFKSSS